MTSLNLTSLLTAARQKGRDDHKSGESAKLGTLRAGTTGILSENGDIAGQCHRKAHLRSLGVEIETPTVDKLIMFELGFANEQVILDQLNSIINDNIASAPEGRTSPYVILTEEEIPISWKTSNGTVVSGRPDIVICEVSDRLEYEILKETPKPLLGIEAKSCHSLWTVRDVLFGGAPKLDHMVQAAHYMWKLNIPYKIIYKGYSQLGQGAAGQSDNWVVKQFPKPGDPMSEHIEYTYYEKRWDATKGKTVNSKRTEEEYWNLPPEKRNHGLKHLKQFEVVYDLRIDTHGRIQYKRESSDIWTNTIVTTQDIERYFEFVSQMAQKQDLGPRPMTLDTSGEKANYSSCGYCPLQKVCDTTDKQKLNYTQWLDLVKKEVQK